MLAGGALEAMPENRPREHFEKQRLRFLVAILYLLDLRIPELENHSWNAFRLHQWRWWFFAKGKGDKLGKIPVNAELLNHIKVYQEHLALSEFPSPEEQMPLIVTRKGKGLTDRYMSHLLKELAINAALQYFADQPAKREKLVKFSPHWLRHLSATMQDRAGIAFKYTQANHRHESETTTRLYVHALDEERHEDIEKLSFQLILSDNILSEL
jgi:integrase/recombinase XerC